MATPKPDISKVWATNALPGDITDPDTEIPGKIEQGWVGTDIPPHDWFNYYQNQVDVYLNHINIEGTPIWDGDTKYVLNSYSKDPTTGRIYRSLTGTELLPNVGNQPSLSPTEWREMIEMELEIVVAPVNLAPTAGVPIADTTPTLVTSEYRSLYGLEHIDSEYRVARDAAMTDLVYLSGSLGPVEEHTITTPLALDDTYYWDARYQDIDGSWSTRSTPTSFILPISVVQAPNPQTPINGALDVTDTVVLTADDFASLPASTHSASQWQISTDPTFTTVDFDSGEDVVNLTSFTQAGLSLTTAYYWRVRYKSNTIGFSDWSVVFSFNTVAATVATPVNEMPPNTESGIGNSVQLVGSEFMAVPAASQAHVSSQWQVATDPDFNTILFDSGEDNFNLTSIIATGLQADITTHYWRVRYRGDVTSWSTYSAVTSFTTVKDFADWSDWDGTADGPISTQSGNSGNSAATPKSDLAPIGGDRFVKVVSNNPVEWTVIGVDGVVLSTAAQYAPSPPPTSPTATSVISAGANRAVGLYATSSVVRARVMTIDGNEIEFGNENTISAGIATQQYWNVDRIDDDNFLLIEQSGGTTQPFASICTIIDEDTISQGAKLPLTSTGDQGCNYGSNVAVIGNRAIMSSSPGSAAIRYRVLSLDTVTKTVTEEVVGAIFNPAEGSASVLRNAVNVKWLTETTFVSSVVETSGSPFDWYIIVGTYDPVANTIKIDTSSKMPQTLPAANNVPGFAILSPQEIMVAHSGIVAQTQTACTYVRIVNGNVFPQTTVDNNLGSATTATTRKSTEVVGEGRVFIATGGGSVGSYGKILNGGAA